MPSLKSIKKNIITEDDEELIKAVRQSYWNLLVSLIPPIFLIVLAFFLIFPLFYWGTGGIVIFAVLLTLGLIIFVKKIILWYFTLLLITNKRVVDIDQKKIFSRVVSDIPLGDIKEVFYDTSGLAQTITRTGNIQIILTDAEDSIQLKNIARPRQIQQLIIQRKSNIFPQNLQPGSLTAEELIKLVEQIKAGIGEEKFREIIERENINDID